MDKTQLTIALLTALTPTVTVLLATLIQRQDVRDLRNEMRSEISSLRTDMQSQMINLRTDMQSQMVNLRNQVHADLLMIHERVAKVEAKQS